MPLPAKIAITCLLIALTMVLLEMTDVIIEESPKTRIKVAVYFILAATTFFSMMALIWGAPEC